MNIIYERDNFTVRFNSPDELIIEEGNTKAAIRVRVVDGEVVVIPFSGSVLVPFIYENVIGFKTSK